MLICFIYFGNGQTYEKTLGIEICVIVLHDNFFFKIYLVNSPEDARRNTHCSLCNVLLFNRKDIMGVAT